MKTSVIPDNEAAWLAMRKPNVNSTESAMLYGLSPYGTLFELWHHKRDGADVAFDSNERMEWGQDLQDAIAISLARRYGLAIRKFTEYISLNDVRMGSSFDFEVVGISQCPDDDSDQILQMLFLTHGPGILEIKNVDSLVFRNNWLNDDKTIAPPGHIEIQVQHQLHVSGHKWAAIGVLVGGNTGKLVTRMADLDVGASLESRITEFWESIEEGAEPDPIYSGDAAFVASLYGYAEPGKVFDGRGNEELAALCEQYRAAAEREKEAKSDKETAKAQTLRIIGDAERAILDRYTISAGLIGPAHIEYDRAGYRNLRVTEKK